MNSAHKPAQLPPIENMVVKGVEQGLVDLFDISSDAVMFIATTDRMRMAQRVKSMKEGPQARLQWPLMFMSLNSVALGTTEQLHGSNTRSTTRHGRYIKLNDDQGRVLRVSLVPTIFEFELTYVVDDFQKAFRYSAAWMAAAINNRLNFSLNYGGESLDIRAVMSDTLTTPQREESVDQPNAFEYTSTVRVAGYVTDPHREGTSSVPLVRGTFEASIAASPPEDPARFSFKRPTKVWGNDQ